MDKLKEDILNGVPSVLSALRQMYKEEYNKFHKQMQFNIKTSDLLKQAFAGMEKIDSKKLFEKWIEPAKKLGKYGWTLSGQMDWRRFEEISKIKEVAEIDKKFEYYYEKYEVYNTIKDDLLKKEHLIKWRGLLQQCFSCYEKGDYYITIPSLFSVIEGLTFELIKKETKLTSNSDIASQKRKLWRRTFKGIDINAEYKGYYSALHVSAYTFISETFSFGDLEKENPQRPPVINRNWVLHGRDNPFEWSKMDALRLINAIHTLSDLEFLLEEVEE
ncbi:hypothetical protein [Bacillus bingmayongensis]|uniref:hypothetical protein n=1 Tax=Bacillus bingmayongensis TaxID=1150157 RepID=UPI0002E19EAD|nr:hypothetical protein [Bacillus bingmayongensis]